MPVDQANRCNAETDALMAERAKIFSDVEAAVNQRTQYEQLRDAVTATTLSNAAKEKANNAEREALNAQKSQLEATRKRLEAKLEDLKRASILRQSVDPERRQLRDDQGAVRQYTVRRRRSRSSRFCV